MRRLLSSLMTFLNVRQWHFELGHCLFSLPAGLWAYCQGKRNRYQCDSWLLDELLQSQSSSLAAGASATGHSDISRPNEVSCASDERFFGYDCGERDDWADVGNPLRWGRLRVEFFHLACSGNPLQYEWCLCHRAHRAWLNIALWCCWSQ